MNKLMSNEAATSYSGQGRKKKLPFINLKLFDALTGKYYLITFKFCLKNI